MTIVTVSSVDTSPSRTTATSTTSMTGTYTENTTAITTNANQRTASTQFTMGMITATAPAVVMSRCLTVTTWTMSMTAAATPPTVITTTNTDRRTLTDVETPGNSEVAQRSSRFPAPVRPAPE